MVAGKGQGTTSLREQRYRRVREAFADLPQRYLGADPGFDATFQIRLGDVGRTWEVRIHDDRAEVHPSPTRDPDVVIGTDAATWLSLREGRMSGLDAFAQRRLYAHGDLDLALAFEGLFLLPGGRPPLLRIAEVEAGSTRLSTLIAGDGARAGDLHSRPGLEQDVVLRDRRGADARAHRPRARPAGLRLLGQARARPL